MVDIESQMRDEVEGECYESSKRTLTATHIFHLIDQIRGDSNHEKYNIYIRFVIISCKLELYLSQVYDRCFLASGERIKE